MEAEAGNRTQSVVKQAGNNTGVNGEMVRVKQVLEKCLTPKMQPDHKMHTSSSTPSQHLGVIAVISEGRIGKLDYLNPLINRKNGTSKNGIKVWGKVENPSR
jgi:hypothetical protein